MMDFTASAGVMAHRTPEGSNPEKSQLKRAKNESIHIFKNDEPKTKQYRCQFMHNCGYKYVF